MGSLLGAMQHAGELLRVLSDGLLVQLCFFSEFLMSCSTSVLDSIGDLKGIGRPSAAEDAGRNLLTVFDALFGLSQASTVSLLLILAVCQQIRV